MIEPTNSLPVIERPTAATPPPPDPKEPKRGGPGRVIGIGLLVAVIGFGGGVAGFFAADQWLDDGNTGSAAAQRTVTTPAQPSNSNPSSSTVRDDGDGLTPREVYSKVSPAVVHIDARITKTETNFFGMEQEQEATGTGSGFVIDEQGHIVTNAHVIEDAKELTVSFGSDGPKLKAKVVGEDRSSDIAVLKIDPKDEALDGKSLTTVAFGDSQQVQVGDPVLAIGNPFSLDRTLTTGVVSALQREIPALNDFAISNVIQTDAAVNPGNSGGPLLNMDGEVIGVNSQIQSRGGGFDGIAFAVPSSTVEKVVDQLIDKGSVEYAWLGLAGGQVTPEIAKEYDLDVDQGVLVGEVTEGSPADKAGLQGSTVVTTNDGQEERRGGDVILTVDGEKLTTMRQLADIVDSKQPGDEIKVEFIHDGKRKETTVKLASRASVDDNDNQQMQQQEN